jgi:hypothetical protein
MGTDAPPCISANSLQAVITMRPMDTTAVAENLRRR